MMKMITQTKGLNFFSQLIKQVGLCCGLFLFLSTLSFGQCFNDSYLYGSAIIDNSGATSTIAGDSWPGEYSLVSGITAGETYQFVMEGKYITLHEGTYDGPVVAFGPSPLDYVALSDLNIYPHWNTDELCGTEYIGTLTSVQCLTCIPDCEILGLNIGSSCDDGDAETILDTVNELCECVGEPIPDAPANDFACDATEIFCGDVLVGNNEYATHTASKCNGSTGGNDLWYSYTPDVNMMVTLETCLEGTDFDTDISVFTGSCDELACEPGFGGAGYIDGSSACVYASWASTGTFVAYAGITYTIQVTGFSSSSLGNFVMSISCEEGDPTPLNDVCENAPLLVCGVNTAGSTEFANPALEGQEFCGEAGSSSAPGVWYSLFTMNDEPVIVDLSGSDFDTKLFVYTGLCGQLTCFDSDDDAGEGTTSMVQFDGAAGTYYYFYVTGFGSNNGNYDIAISCGYDCVELEAYIGDSCDDLNSGTYNDVVTENCECAGIEFECLELEANIGDACDDLVEGTENDIVTENCECVGTEIPEAPENDLACDALEIFCGEIIIGTTADATHSASKCNGSAGGNDVWFSFTPDEAMTVTLETCLEGTTFDTDLSVFTGSCDALECLSAFGGSGYIDGNSSCSFASWASGGSFDAEPGVTYTIQLTGFGSYNYGDFALSISCEIGVDCPELGLNIGASCDDGDENTIGDTVNENCGCVGIAIPENDLCENAIEINCGDLVTGNNSAASNTHNKCNGSTGGKDVWYSFTSDVNATVYLENCLEGTTFDTDLSVFTGVCDALECEPTFGGNGHIDGASSCAFASWASGGEFVAIAGVEYTIQLTGYSSSNQGDFAMSISCVEIFDCPEFEANIGGACDDGDAETENDIVGEDCGCAGTPIPVSDCEDWVMYYNNNAGGATDIYSVDISSGDAELSFITTIGYQGHIAYNPADNLIYVLHNGNGSYVTVNPHTAVPEVSAPIFLSQDIPSITTAAFAPNGKLIVGSATQNIIYSINTADQAVSVYDAYAPINGGDIAFDSAGMLYLATRSGNGFYQVYPDDVLADQLIGTLPSLVTGMALTESGQMIMSHKANAALQLRNLDGSDSGVSYPLTLDGAAYLPLDGDMTSGCNTFQDNNEGDCAAFSSFYVSHGPGISGSDLYRVEFSGTNANLTLLTNVAFEAHIAYNAQDDIVYLVNANGNFIRAYDPSAGIFLGDLPIVGGINQLYAVAYNEVNGQLYLGDAGDDEIFSVDLGTGVATYFADAPVDGGDLAFQNGNMVLATRSGDKLYSVVEGGAAVLLGSIPTDVNGMAQANNATGLVMANTAATVFTEVSAVDGSIVTLYNALLDGEEFTMVNGDMAAGCADDQSLIITGECNATEVYEYVEGTTLGGGVITASRSDANQALGAPERTDAMVFTTLGYGGSITLGFNGAIPNGAGDDIEVVETSFNNPGCASYPEFADVSVSLDGISWFSAGTVCKGEPFVDISDAGDFDYVMFVRVSNIDDQTTSGDGFDLDGVVALHNCEEGAGVNENDNVNVVAGLSTISSYPNPTNGPSQVVFVAAETGRTLVEVYDMNGRNVTTLYNQEAQAGLEYRVDFNGASLPNGVYIFKLTTNSETIIDKFMIAR